MATTSWMRYSNSRYGRFQRGRYVNKEDDINFDVNSDSRQNVTSILSALCQISDLTDGKRLNYLNAFVKVTLHIEGNFENIGFSMRDILCCLRIALLHESTQVRSGGLRAIRHVLRNEDDIAQLNKLLIPFLIARSLDLVLKNDVERIEAMKLIRKILMLSPSNFHIALGRSLVSLANGVVEERDRMLRICLATLCELGMSVARGKPSDLNTSLQGCSIRIYLLKPAVWQLSRGIYSNVKRLKLRSLCAGFCYCYLTNPPRGIKPRSISTP
jgi:rapamycin-insensitive companion of mTOR